MEGSVANRCGKCVRAGTTDDALAYDSRKRL